jgi:hypothetical protein
MSTGTQLFDRAATIIRMYRNINIVYSYFAGNACPVGPLHFFVDLHKIVKMNKDTVPVRSRL